LSTRELLEIECPNFSKFISGLVCVLQCCIGYIVVVCHSWVCASLRCQLSTSWLFTLKCHHRCFNYTNHPIITAMCAVDISVDWPQDGTTLGYLNKRPNGYAEFPIVHTFF